MTLPFVCATFPMGIKKKFCKNETNSRETRVQIPPIPSPEIEPISALNSRGQFRCQGRPPLQSPIINISNFHQHYCWMRRC